MNIKISFLLAGYMLLKLCVPVYGQKDTITDSKNIDLKEIKVIGQRSPEIFRNTARSITVIDESSIKNSPNNQLLDALETNSHVDIRSRGIEGAQADFTMRGGTFDQTAILLNGVNITDAQTGHLNSTLPFDFEDVSRIEVLNGSGSRVYGANAFKGAINFITEPVSDKVTTGFSLGQYGYKKANVSVSRVSNYYKSYISYSRLESDGEYANTDILKNKIFYYGQIGNDKESVQMQFGTTAKEFGAEGFYSARYPNEFEINKSSFANIKYVSAKTVNFTSGIYWRRHKDEFQLFRDSWYSADTSGNFISVNPNAIYDTMPFPYTNKHLTDIFGAQINASYSYKKFSFSLGGDLRSENIQSNSLGIDKIKPIRIYNDDDNGLYTKQYQRNILNTYAEINYKHEKFSISSGLLANWISDFPEKLNINPGIDVAYWANRNNKIYASYNHSLGMPTFTDLFYYGPSNQGNVDLKPYTENAVDLGFQHFGRTISGNISAFYTKGKDVIQWLWNSEAKFSPINVEKYISRGVEAGININLNEQKNIPIAAININYAYVDLDKSLDGSIRKYSNLKHKFALQTFSKKIGGLSISITYKLSEREGEYFIYNFEEDVLENHSFGLSSVLDARLNYKYRFFGAYVQASNIFDDVYHEIGVLPQPGRWLKGGIILDIPY